MQCSVGGVFLAQYKAADEAGLEAFANITDIDVVETPLRIVAVGDKRLLIATER